ncbi:hypothetical protein Moror_11912 [Moniliophthora roreri MCA 2997]|uniref:Yeast cell wall synthesis Kre9/Knh1-like N-terminal domain-containing protein n=1 Tax=Moniliophthora roreri (strain MCA 2997) TaxID=1381753 RepID=V2WZT3_MONRO|nr:hypothetical protein Moror_11912 [Moniliophthora roreri MCA 2997]KAI3619343.1 hypothetical protein WG66_012810 [Moniliophthora roreri]
MQFKNLLFAAALAVCATASPHERRQGEGGIWNPKITSPNDKTVWCVGKTVKVTWDTSGKPQNFNDNPAIFLFSDIDFKLSETLKDWKSFSLNAGSIDVKVPEVKDGKEYFINLASDSGNRSPKFSIKHC